MLVDDDPAILRLLNEWLAAAGYRVRRAGDGRQAMAAVEEDCPELLVTDWEMPGVGGLELCRWVRRQDLAGYVYTLFLTAHTDPESLIQGLEAGADDFLQKPVQKGELLARLRAGVRVLEMENRLRLLARTDSLTGLATRRALRETLDKEWKHARRHHFPLACVMLDLDFFKRINDTHGHPVGDEVLRQVGRVLTENGRVGDCVSRIGGEEFCALLTMTEEDRAAVWADRTRQMIADLVIPVNGETIRITASFGVAQPLPETETPEQLVDMADQALLVAKASGRNRVVRFRAIDRSGRMVSVGSGRESLFRGAVAGDVMTPTPVAIRHDDTVGRAAEHLLRCAIDSAPVVDDAGHLVGVLSDKDVMAVLSLPEAWSAEVKDAMKTNPVCYQEDSPLGAIHDFLSRAAIDGAIVVKDGRPVGTVRRSDLLRWSRDYYGDSRYAACGRESLHQVSGFPWKVSQPCGRPP